jgi:hypothetical protein
MSAKSILLLLLCVILTIFLSSLFIPSLDTMIRKIELAVSTGVLRIAGNAPEVREIYVNEYLCEENPPGPSIDGLAGNTLYPVFNATLFDINGDCNVADVHVYVCKNTTGLPCNANRADYNSQMTLYRQNTYYCNFTASNSNLPLHYFERYGNWYINVTAYDPVNPSFYNSTMRYWRYNENGAFLYPVGGDVINLGDITLDSWNNGGENTTRNIGNIRLNLTWNATDFICTDSTCPGPNNVIEINGTNFCVENNTVRTNECGYINTDPLIRIEYFPTGGMRRCGNFDCSQDEEFRTYPNNLANYSLWWHINVLSPKESGIYRNKIEVVSRFYTDEG